MDGENCLAGGGGGIVTEDMNSIKRAMHHINRELCTVDVVMQSLDRDLPCHSLRGPNLRCPYILLTSKLSFANNKNATILIVIGVSAIAIFADSGICFF